MWIDSHAHLYNHSPEELRDELARARSSSVDLILNCGTSIDTSRSVAHQCDFCPEMLLGAVGISPFDTLDLEPGWVGHIEHLCRLPGIVAIGEIGIDASNPRYPPVSIQRPVLEKQLSVAVEAGLPVVLHSRGAESLVLDICRNWGVTKAVFHCFTGDVETLKRIESEGYYVSLSGIVTFKRSGLDSLVTAAAHDRLLIETDTPYLAPVPHRGEVNHPAWVGLIGAYCSKALKMDEQEFASNVRRNFLTLFPSAKPNALEAGC